MKLFFFFTLLCILTSCGATYTTDFNKQLDFADFTSYQFYGDIDSGLNVFDDKRIKIAIDSAFQRRGFIKTDYCRFYVNFYASEIIQNSRNTLGIGVGSGGDNVGVGVSGGIPIGGRVINQQLTIDIIDASHDQELAWQIIIDGEIKEKATPAQKEAYYYKVISKALQKFPPKTR